MRKVIFLVFGGFFTSCLPYQKVNSKISEGLPVPPRGEPVEIYYPGYRMPDEAYYETGVFEFKTWVHRGAPDNLLPQEIKRRNLDGAIILDRRQVWNLNNRAFESLTCMGLLMAEHAEEVRWVKQVEVEWYQDSILIGKAHFDFAENGQILSDSGHAFLIRLSRSIQPWFFREQINTGWSEKPAQADWPDRRLKEGQRFTFWKKKEEVDSLIYQVEQHDFQKVRSVLLKDLGDQWVPAFVWDQKGSGTVESHFLVNRLKKQIWHRPAYGQRLIYRYGYGQIKDNDKYKLVRPEDLQQ